MSVPGGGTGPGALRGWGGGSPAAPEGLRVILGAGVEVWAAGIGWGAVGLGWEWWASAGTEVAEGSWRELGVSVGMLGGKQISSAGEGGERSEWG